MSRKSLEETQHLIVESCSQSTKSKKKLLCICEDIYPMIKECEDSGEALKYVFEKLEELLPNLSENEKISDDPNKDSIVTKRQALGRQYRTLADGILYGLVYNNPESSMFYAKLWEQINTNPLFTNDDARVFALYDILLDGLVPYYHLNTDLNMSEEDVDKYFMTLLPKIKKARFIALIEFESKTERAFQFIELIDSVKDKKERTLLLAYIIEFCNANMDRENDKNE